MLLKELQQISQKIWKVDSDQGKPAEAIFTLHTKQPVLSNGACFLSGTYPYIWFPLFFPSVCSSQVFVFVKKSSKVNLCLLPGDSEYKQFIEAKEQKQL